jgi:2-aminophenol/2-amino-5-chlorophenol 1,6-dioxygenase alpha subunit
MRPLCGFVLPGVIHPLLAPDAHPGYRRLRNAFEAVREKIAQSGADVIVIYSTMWPSILGHQVQSRSLCEWTFVDDDFHDLGSVKYSFRMDKELAQEMVQAGQRRGLQMKSVDYHGFPIDSGSVMALKLLNPDNRIPAMIVSSNIYADRAETVVLGKALLDALSAQKKKAAVVVISTLSNRLHQTNIDPKEDKIHSLKDQEWNLKILEFLGNGRLEDVAQLSRQIHKEARVRKVNNFKPFWWLSTVMGPHNKYHGEVLAYEPVYGTGCAVVGLYPASQAARDLEFDEDSPDFFSGERNVLGPSLNESAGLSSQTLNAGLENDNEPA